MILATSPLWLPALLFLLYCVGVQYEREGLPKGWHVFFSFFAVVALLLDVVLNYTLFIVYTWDIPQAREYTFSDRLGRLERDTGWRGKLARPIVWVLNKIAPSGRHIGS